MPPPIPNDHTDAVTVRRLRAGDRATFQALVKELNPGLTRMARTYVTAALADEVVQETWLSVIKSLDSYEGRSALKTWIYRIMLNKVRTLATRESKIVPFTSIGPSDDSDRPAVESDRLVHPDLGTGYWPEAPTRWETIPDARMESEQTTKAIAEAINALPAAQKEVVALRDIEGWSADQVCNALGISTVNQRVLLHRGRVAVRQALEDFLS